MHVPTLMFFFRTHPGFLADLLLLIFRIKLVCKPQAVQERQKTLLDPMVHDHHRSFLERSSDGSVQQRSMQVEVLVRHLLVQTDCDHNLALHPVEVRDRVEDDVLVVALVLPASSRLPCINRSNQLEARWQGGVLVKMVLQYLFQVELDKPLMDEYRDLPVQVPRVLHHHLSHHLHDVSSVLARLVVTGAQREDVRLDRSTRNVVMARHRID
mmetsp:Transcript_38494/g.121286  ORF Transcript_38494/g.121286 Transcript_38494/m.121286 type:complete len:212 (-) Transcript_38494:2736-3371(-)